MSVVIDRGVYTSIKIKIKEDIDFNNIDKLVFTVKNNVNNKPILTFDFYEAGEHIVEITPEQSLKITDNALYDFDLISKDEKRYKITENEPIVLRKGVGSAYD